LQACSDGCGVKRLDDFIVGENVETLNSDVTAGEVQHPKLIDEVRVAVGAGEGYRSVLHGEDERRGVLCRTGCGWCEGKSECGGHDGSAKQCVETHAVVLQVTRFGVRVKAVQGRSHL
jgi:hypothetical protein